MKNWKTVVVTVLVILLVVVLANVAWNKWETRAIRSRIAQYGLMKQEQQLALDILNLRYETAVIKSKFQPAPQAAPPPLIKE